MEVSAKTGENIDDVFLKIAELLVDEFLPNRVVERQRYSLCSNASLALKEDKRTCEC
jgi:hypothetical protein